MSRPPSETLTARETQVMEAVWRLGEATAEQVREALPRPLHDSSVRTLLRTLESKGYLRHEARGKAYVYFPKVGRAKAQGKALRDLLARFFGGSAEDLVLRLLEEDENRPVLLRRQFQRQDIAGDLPAERQCRCRDFGHVGSPRLPPEAQSGNIRCRLTNSFGRHPPRAICRRRRLRAS